MIFRALTARLPTSCELVMMPASSMTATLLFENADPAIRPRSRPEPVSTMTRATVGRDPGEDEKRILYFAHDSLHLTRLS